MKILITKQMSQDEQLQCEVNAETAEQMRVNLDDALALLDARLVLQGQRVIDATTAVQKLPVEVRQAINAVMGILFGRPGSVQELQVAQEAIEKVKQ